MCTRSEGRTESVLMEVHAERVRQAAKHGHQHHLPDGTGPDRQLMYELWDESTLPLEGTVNAFLAVLAKRRCGAASQDEGGDGSITFEHILTEEWAEAVAEEDPARLREELIQVAAVAVQWVEAIDARP